MAWVYQTSTMGDAHIKAAIVDQPGLADLCVFLVSNRGFACGDAYWFVDDCRDSAHTRVYFTAIGMAQVKVCFVKNRGLAGWKNEHRLKGRFR